MPSTLILVFILSLLGSLTPTARAADFWTVNCAPLTQQRSDPIVDPDGPSKHVHAISGGTAFSRSMRAKDSAVVSKQTTCDKFTDHSNYWCPQLYNRRNGKFELVPYTGVNIYYKRLTCDYNANERWCPSKKTARPFPPGLRMVAGDATRRTYTNDQTGQSILIDGGSGEKPGFPKLLNKNFQMNVRFPSCWDGVNIDSPNHKSHVAYPDPAKGDTAGGMCPKSHPVALIHMGAEFGFDTTSLGISDTSTLVFSNGDTTGYGGHGDFLQGWVDLKALANSFDNCNGAGEACAWNSYGTPDGKMGTKKNLKPEASPVYEEEIGLKGPIDKLPGDNPAYVQGQPPQAPVPAAGSSVSPSTSKSGTPTKPIPSSVTIRSTTSNNPNPGTTTTATSKLSSNSSIPSTPVQSTTSKKLVISIKSTAVSSAITSNPALSTKPNTTATRSSTTKIATTVRPGQNTTIISRIVNITRTVAITQTKVVTKTAEVTRTRYVCNY